MGNGRGSFVHLHCHTHNSMLDGAAKTEAMVEAAARDGQPALAITDHGNLYGLIEHYQACLASDIKPILGCELYADGESRHNRFKAKRAADQALGGLDVATTGKTRDRYHQIALALDTQGYYNLIGLASEAYLSGYYGKPRVDWELLDRYKAGIALTSSCLGGMVPQALLSDQPGAALQIAGRLQDMVGRANFFIELQDHGIPDQHRVMGSLVDLARRIGAPLLATNDAHYVHSTDAKMHDTLLCIQTKALLSDEKRFKFQGSGHWLRTAAEMRAVFADYPEACDNTLNLAERVQVDIQHGMELLPDFGTPEQFQGEDDPPRAYLRHLVYQGAYSRYGSELSTEVCQRVDHELGVIADMGFSSYFLIVWDIINWADNNGVRRGPGRGSAVGSVVSYCLNISQLDPLRWDLYFERFLNTGRRQMPDIDLDIDDNGRAAILRYCSERWGPDRVAQIVTFASIKSRSAVRDTARALGKPYALGNAIAKAMPPLAMGRDVPLSVCLSPTPLDDPGYERAAPLRQLAQDDPEVAEVLQVATGLEGLRRSDGIHGSAVVIADRPLHHLVPVQRKPPAGTDPSDSPLITQYEMHAVEWLGLLKVDLLGLRTLSVIEDTIRMVSETAGVQIDVNALPLDDPEVYKLLAAGDTTGVFQLEGSAIRRLAQSLAPDCFDDVGALLALYRPGPMGMNMHNDYADYKNKRREPRPLHPALTALLAPTYQLCIYQEQLMQIATEMAGFDLAAADDLRKACGKKDRALLATKRDQFIAGCITKGYSKQVGVDLFDIIVPFADYGFNKSHAYSYGLITYQTAWLKAHWPAQYFAAVLTSVADDADRIEYYVSECRRMGIAVRVPDINRSKGGFGAVSNDSGGYDILFGIGAIKGLGDTVEQHLIQLRAERPFDDFWDFAARIDTRKVTQPVLESLIAAGAFSGMQYTRKGLTEIAAAVVRDQQDLAKRRAEGVVLLFEDPAGQRSVSRQEWPERTLQNKEKAALSYYVSSHPLDRAEPLLRRLCDMSVRMALTKPPERNKVITLGGIIQKVERKTTKKGAAMGVVTLSGLGGAIEVVFMPRDWPQCAWITSSSEVMLITGTIQSDGDSHPKMFGRSAQRARGQSAPPVRIDLPATAPGALLEQLKGILVAYPGWSSVYLVRGNAGLERLPSRWDVDASPQLLGSISTLLRPGTAAGHGE